MIAFVFVFDKVFVIYICIASIKWQIIKVSKIIDIEISQKNKKKNFHLRKKQKEKTEKY